MSDATATSRDRQAPGGAARRRAPGATVLRRVPYEVYCQLVEAESNDHLRMAFHDGTLEIMSPHLWMHEIPSVRISTLVRAVARHLGLSFQSARNTTFRRRGGGVYGGQGKEPDESFYIANVARLPRDRDPNLDAGDPPPDLWIEVDNRGSSKAKLPIYANLGVPEVWRYRSRSKSLIFLRLVEGRYEPIERSMSFPALTTALVRDALDLGDGLYESEWEDLLRDWVARTIPRPGPG